MESYIIYLKYFKIFDINKVQKSVMDESTYMLILLSYQFNAEKYVMDEGS